MIKQGLACAALASSLLFMGGSDVREITYTERVIAAEPEFAVLEADRRDSSMMSLVIGEESFAEPSGELDFDKYCLTPHKVILDKAAEFEKMKESASEPETEASETETDAKETPKKETSKKEETKKETSKNTSKKEETTKADVPMPSPLTEEQFALMLAEAEKYLGYEYVWGGSTPETSFDCSGYVSWGVNNSGIGMNIGRINSKSIYRLCVKVSKSELMPGDLVFFKGTYATSGVSHVGIYVGDGKMIHCGSKVAYADLTDGYWRSHFYAYGRLPNK